MHAPDDGTDEVAAHGALRTQQTNLPASREEEPARECGGRERTMNVHMHLNARPRLLALHGAGANSAVVRLQLTNLGLGDDDFELFCLDGPLPDQSAADSMLEAMVDGPYFSWYESADAVSRAAAEAALVSVLACVKRHGPFDGIFGFSQGAAVAMALLQEDVFEALRPPVEGGGAAALAPLRALSLRTGRAHAPPSQAEAAVSPVLLRRPESAYNMGKRLSSRNLLNRRSSRNSHAANAPEVRARRASGGVAQPAQMFRFAILAHAAPPDALRIALGLPSAGGSVAVPSVHVIGVADNLKPSSEASALAFVGGGERLVLYHDAAHALPRELQTNALLRARLLAHVDAALLGATRDSPSLLSSVGRAAVKAQPVGFRHRRHVVRSLEDEHGHVHVVSPQAGWSNDEVETSQLQPGWRAINRLSRIWVSADQQLVCCHADTPRGAARTLRQLLGSQPAASPCLRERGFALATYGALLEFISPGGGGDLRRLGVGPGEVVAYAAPGGSALAAVAFLAVASQAVAVPLDPALSEPDAARALQQLRPRHLILFEHVPSPGLRAAAAAAAAKGLEEEQEGAEEEERSLQVHEATALCPSAPAGLFKLPELGPSDIETRERGASLQPGQLVSATSSDLLRLSAAGDVSDEKMGWHRSPPLSRSTEETSLLLRTSGTTSRPKGVPLAQEQLVRNASLLAASLELSQGALLHAHPLRPFVPPPLEWAMCARHGSRRLS